MTRLPNTSMHRIAKLEHGRRYRTHGVVIHVMDGNLNGTIDWWSRRGNTIGAHLCVGKSKAVQTADLDAVCYHAPGANATWVGIEHEGTGHDSMARWTLRRTQRVLSANRCAWILYHYRCGTPKWGKNVKRHSEFGGSHPNCPGKGFPVILYMAAVNRAYNNLVKSRGKTWDKTSGEPTLRQGQTGPSVVTLKKLLYDKGYRNFSGENSSNRYNPFFGQHTAEVVRRFQRDRNMAPDGVVGPNTWTALRK